MNAAIAIAPPSADLKKANHMIARFITSCSHELRSPLKSIQGLVNLLYKWRHYPETDTITFLNLIGKTVARMENMLDSFEYLMENTKRTAVNSRVDIAKIVSNVFRSYHDEIVQSRIVIKTRIVGMSTVYSDGPRLHIILSELLKNAIHFRDVNKATATVSIEVCIRKKSWAIHIKDNGPGISADEQEKIFNLFYRGSEKSGGVGMGLFVAREAIEKMGGTLSVKSSTDQGTDFEIELPNHS